MKVAGVTSEVTLLEIPGVMFSEDYASLGTLFYFSFRWSRRFAW
jgi:paraquat-inducible protein A